MNLPYLYLLHNYNTNQIIETIIGILIYYTILNVIIFTIIENIFKPKQ